VNQSNSDVCLLETVKLQQEMFLNIASNLSIQHDIAEDLRDEFKKRYKKDPFEELKQQKYVENKYKTTSFLPGIQQQPTNQQFSGTPQKQDPFFGSTSTNPTSTSQFDFSGANKKTSFSFGTDTLTGGGGISSTPSFNFGGDSISGSFSLDKEDGIKDQRRGAFSAL
jgi:hypothetical protein